MQNLRDMKKEKIKCGERVKFFLTPREERERREY